MFLTIAVECFYLKINSVKIYINNNIFNLDSFLLTDPKLKNLTESQYEQLKQWFRNRLDDAIKAAEEEKLEGSVIFGDGKLL